MKLFHVEQSERVSFTQYLGVNGQSLPPIAVNKFSLKVQCVLWLFGFVLASSIHSAGATAFANQRLILGRNPTSLEGIHLGGQSQALSSEDIHQRLLQAGLTAQANDWSRWKPGQSTWVDQAAESPIPLWIHNGLWVATGLSALGTSTAAFENLLIASASVSGLGLVTLVGNRLYKDQRELSAANAIVDYDNALMDEDGLSGPRYRRTGILDGVWRSALLPGWGLGHNGHPWIGASLGLISVGLLGYGYAIELHGLHPYSNPELEHGFVIGGWAAYGVTLLFSALSNRISPDLDPRSTRVNVSLLPGGMQAAWVHRF